jgi:hypothetical protein
LFAQQDRERRILDEVDRKVLTQQEVVERLLPRAQTEWTSLANKAGMGTLTVHDLDATFGRLPEAAMREELRLLYTTSFSGGGAFGYSVETSAAQLLDYRLLRKLGRWLPSIIALYNELAPLCNAPVHDDLLHAKLQVSRAFYRGDLFSGGQYGERKRLICAFLSPSANFTAQCSDF